MGYRSDEIDIGGVTLRTFALSATADAGLHLSIHENFRLPEDDDGDGNYSAAAAAAGSASKDFGDLIS